ncbi:hypothetical protein RJT34_23929 [Clitoria ternatea]|uniref:PHD-type domain-containing protein n=1 Tax=Clitoria ternatea TaxID=43366 RepID=A0AAN9IIU4_CLITE
MDNDDDPSALAWLWVIETLSGFKEITIPTLQGLIDAAPVGVDAYSEKTRELVAMRCLGELCGYTNGVELGTSSNLDSRVGFDFSRSCEDVLQEISREIPLSNLKMAGRELLKWDVCSFVKHKRASAIKCNLEQLKESILDGTQPHTDYVKERSGLFHQNSSHNVHVNDGECADYLEKDNEHFTHAENMGEKENSVTLIEHLLDSDFSPSKRNMVYSAEEHLTRHLHEKCVYINECDDFLRNSKRIKCHASTSFESKKEKPVFQLRKVSETSTEKSLLIFEEVGHHTENNHRATLGNGSLEESHGRFSASNLCQSNSHNEVFRDECNIPFNTTLMAQHMSGGENSQQQQVESIPANVTLSDGIQHEISGNEPRDKHETDLQFKTPNGFQQTMATAKAPDGTGNSCRVEITGDLIFHQGEEINLSTKKHEEKNLGMKCNEGDQLLVCDAITVPPVVPERCLNMTTTFMRLNTSGTEPCENTCMHETTDTVHHVEPISTNGDNTDTNQHMISEPQLNQKEPNVASSSFSLMPVASDKTVVDAVDSLGAELLGGSDGYHKNKNDLAAKKHEFVSSHCTHDQNFSAMSESTEDNLCMKCNESGQLLVCKTTTCALMVHKTCLGASARLDAEGNFFCPFCAYSRAIAEYLEAKKKASVARKELAVFIGKGIRKQATELVHGFNRQEHCLPKRSSSKCEDIHIKNKGDDQLTECEGNDREVNVGEYASEANILLFKRSQQQAPISHAHSPCMEKENVNEESLEVLRKEKIGEMSNIKSLNGGRVEEMETDLVGEHDKFACEKTNIVSVNQSNGEEVPQKRVKQYDITGTLQPDCEHDSGNEEISEDECEKHIISGYSMRMRKHETHCSKTQTSPQLKRKIIPWTAEEEEEGIQKFGCKDTKIPWKNILAFGSHVFGKYREHFHGSKCRDDSEAWWRRRRCCSQVKAWRQRGKECLDSKKSKKCFHSNDSLLVTFGV